MSDSEFVHKLFLGMGLVLKEHLFKKHPPFEARHRYQFLLYYLSPYLKRKQQIDENRIEGLTAQGVLETILYKWVQKWIHEPAFLPFGKYTLYALPEEVMDFYMTFVAGKNNYKVTQLDPRPFRGLQYAKSGAIDIEGYVYFLKTVRPPVTDLFVLAGLDYFQKYRQKDGEKGQEVWELALNAVFRFCDNHPHRVTEEEQLNVLKKYRHYESLREIHGRMALGIMRINNGWKKRSTEEKEIYLLQRFFSLAEKDWGEAGFHRREYIDYLIPILKRGAFRRVLLNKA